MPRVPRTHQPRPRASRVARSCRVLLGAAIGLLAAGPTAAQDNPVFLDDSTLAADVFSGLPGLLASDNDSEAVRLLQRLLDEEAERLIASEADTDLLVPVRARVHRVLLDDDDLLRRYRSAETDAAAMSLAAGHAEMVERSRLLTRPGFEAALRLATNHISAGRFDSARLTLAQLENHPDGSDTDLASRAARLWVRVAAYLDREDVSLAAQHWHSIAGVPFVSPEAAPWPESLLAPVWTPQHAAEPFSITDLVSTPLCSVDLRPDTAVDEDDPAAVTRRSRRVAEFPYLYPVVSGDTVYTNDGLWVAAWDRFTLTPKWRTKPPGADYEREDIESMYSSAPYRRNRSRETEEANTLAVSGRLLLAATGLVTDGTRSGDPRLHAFDNRTGQVLWSTYIDELDPQLEESSTRGPALIEGDTAIIAVRKISQARRFASAFLVGVDLADGSLRWVRLCGSAGWLAYGNRGQWSDWPTIHNGVVYRVDELGVVCAIEAGSGRFRWVRRLSGVESRMPTPQLPWASSQPIIDGDTLITLGPDRSELLRLDLATGEVLGRRTTRDFGGDNRRPAYIIEHQGRIVAVGPNNITSVAVDKAINGPLRLSKMIPDPGIVGRVVASGDSLLVPMQTGLGALDFQSLQLVQGFPLDAPGNILPLRTQLLTLDNERLHSYLVWEDAAAVLGQRLDENPADTETAITFAELAARAERFDAVLDPVDRALAAMSIDPLNPNLRASQERLFALLYGLLQTGERAANTAQDTTSTPSPSIPADVLAGVAARMEAVAVTPAERSTHLLMRAALHDRMGDPAAAVADCQAVLSDAQLRSAAWSRSASSVRAEVHALAELDRMLKAGGPGLYEPFAREASRRLDALTEPNIETLESLARAYPRSPTSPAAWLALSELHRDAGLALPADRALARGIETVEACRAVGIAVDANISAELLGRRITGLLESQRLDTAAALMQKAADRWPGLVPTVNTEPIDTATIQARLRSRAEARRARAAIGDTLAQSALELPGWVLLRSLDRHDAHARKPGVLILRDGEIGLWGTADSGTGIQPRWTSPFDTKPALLRHEPDRILLFVPSEHGGAVRALDPNDGRELWKADRLGEALANAQGPLGGARERFEAPLDGRVDPGDLLLALDETTVAVVSRAGRVVAIDLRSGKVTWTLRSACHRVHDTAAGDGVLVLAGTSSPPGGASAGEPIVLTLDLASGEEIGRYSSGKAQAAGNAAWVHIAPGSSSVVVGFSRGVVSLSLPEAVPQWTLNGIAVEQTIGAWSLGDRLFIQTSLRELALVDRPTGTLISGRLNTSGCLELGQPIDAVHDGPSLVLLSPAGFARLDRATGALISADALHPVVGGMVQAALGDGRIVMAERDPIPGVPGHYRLHLVDSATGRAIHTATLALRDRPRRIGLLDNTIMITTGDSTVVLTTE